MEAGGAYSQHPSHLPSAAASADPHLFRDRLREKNIASLRVQGYLILILVPLFWILDLLVVPQYALEFLALRLFSTAYAGCQLLLIRFQPRLARRWCNFFGFSSLLIVGSSIALMCWAHNGYESPYYAGLGLVFMAVGSLFVWRIVVAVFFDLLLYLFYMTPLLLGILPVRDPVQVGTHQFFLISMIFISFLAWWHRYRTERSEFLALAALEDTKCSLEDANHRLKQHDDLKNHFFANISHELRTPLTLSLGPVEAILGGKEQLSDRSRDYLRTVRDNQLRLLSLINDLLALAKIEGGRMECTFECVDLPGFTRRLADTVRVAAEERGLRFLVELSDDDLNAYIDVAKFEKVVMNLLSNAFKFTDEGGELAVVLRREDQQAVLEVRDSGVGIPADKLPGVFDRFSQVDVSATREYAGTGIGLALVKEYMELHHGTVEVESKWGHGSCFRLRLQLGKEHLDAGKIIDSSLRDSPTGRVRLEGWHRELLTGGNESQEFPTAEGLYQEHQSMSTLPPVDPARVEPELSEKAQAKLDLVRGSLDNAEVLVVDDTKDMRRYMRSLLDPYHRVRTARDGKEGLELARRYRPDVIVSDVMMPRMSGNELCAALKAEPGRLARTPVILVTARTDDQTKLRALEQGADDYLFKPFHPSELVLRVRNLLRNHSQERALFRVHRELESRQDEMDRDLALAQSFQQSLLRRIGFPKGFDVGLAYRPLIAVGGDLYDLVEIDKDTCRVFIADVTDHGVQAALRTAVVRSEYERVKRHAKSPGELLAMLNQVVIDQHGYEIMFSACSVDIKRIPGGGAAVRYARTGGMVIEIISSVAPRTVEGALGPLLGMIPDAHFDEGYEEFGERDRLMLYTDGLSLQTDRYGSAFADVRLPNLLSRVSEVATSQAALDAVLADWQEFLGEARADNDLTAIVLGVHHG